MTSGPRPKPSAAPPAGRRPLSQVALERRTLTVLRRFPDFADLTAVDVEPVIGGPDGSWQVARVWRGHLVELPLGAAWEAGGRAALGEMQDSLSLRGGTRRGDA